MFDKVTQIYTNTDGNMRLIIPLEFWFAYTSSLALPLVALPYIDVSIKFKLNDQILWNHSFHLLNPQ